MDLHYLEARAGAHWSPLGRNGFKCYNNYLVNFALQIWLTSTRPSATWADFERPGIPKSVFLWLMGGRLLEGPTMVGRTSDCRAATPRRRPGLGGTNCRQPAWPLAAREQP